MKLNPGDTITAAWAERCRGPGWSNQVVWVLVRTIGPQEYRLDVLQPEEWAQNPVVASLFSTSVVVARDMQSAVVALTHEEDKR